MNRCIEGDVKYTGDIYKWSNLSHNKEPSKWVLDRCQTEALPAMSLLLFFLPYFDYAVIIIAIPLFLLQRAPFWVIRNRMITLYNLLDGDNKDEIERKLEVHKAVVKTGKCCRVFDIYNLLLFAKFPFIIGGSVLIIWNWIARINVAKSEQNLGTPCKLGKTTYKCFIVNMEEVVFYYLAISSFAAFSE